MRRVKILGLCLVAVLAMSAIGAASSMAKKSPYSVSTWGQYKYCPYENEALTDCFRGATSGGSGGGEFQYGHIRVKLTHPVVIQGGFKGSGQTVEVSPAAHGGETLEDNEAEPVVKGLNNITQKIQEETEWPEALKQSFNEAKKNKETKAYAKIEMAGDECFEVPGCLSTENLLFEEGVAFRLALKVTISSQWLEKLGGGSCTIGSDEYPIKQLLTSAESGYALEEFDANPEFSNLELAGSKLVDTAWHIEPASGAKGCGGPEYESYVDKALNKLLEVEYSWKTGITWLKGDLFDGTRKSVVKFGFENGELP